MSDVPFIIVRGIPGSGKSTLAKLLAASYMADHREADQWFCRKGYYDFFPEGLYQAHKWCIGSTEDSISNGCGAVVSNTFTTVKELIPYFEIARNFAIRPQIITCHANYGSVHGVPDDKLAQMRARFVHNIDDIYNQWFPVNKENNG